MCGWLYVQIVLIVVTLSTLNYSYSISESLVFSIVQYTHIMNVTGSTKQYYV